jgi:hypothetical protein
VRRFRRTAVAAGIVALLAAGGCRKKTAPPANLNAANAVSVRAVSIYIEGPDMLLAAEVREIPLPANDAGAVPIVVRELLKGSSNAALPRPLPPDSVLRAASRTATPSSTSAVRRCRTAGGPGAMGNWSVFTQLCRPWRATFRGSGASEY